MEYTIVQFVGPFAPGSVVADSSFPDGTDFDRLVRLGAIRVPAGDAPPDPPKVSELRKQLSAVQHELRVANARVAEFEAVAAAQESGEEDLSP